MQPEDSTPEEEPAPEDSTPEDEPAPEESTPEEEALLDPMTGQPSRAIPNGQGGFFYISGAEI